MKTDEELKKLALDLWRGDIYSDRHLADPQELPMVFMPLAMMDKEQIGELQKLKPMFIYEYMSEAGPRSINGRPRFFSFQHLNKEENDIMMDHYQEMRSHYDGLSLPPQTKKEKPHEKGSPI